MGEFLKLEKPSEALRTFLDQIPETRRPSETISTRLAAGRVLVEAILSPEPSPAFNRSTVDGYAVHANDSFGASDGIPAFFKIVGEVVMGKKTVLKVEGGEAAVVHTGGMLPEGCDAVIMVEQTQKAREDQIEVSKAVSPGENVILAGEDLETGEEILEAGTLIRAVEIGGLLAVGLTEINVFRKPFIGVLSSGDELVEPGTSPQPGQIRDINSSMLAVLIEENGGIAKTYELMPDDPRKMREITTRAFSECDALVITAGSSASTRDFTAQIVQELGQPGVIVHGVNIKPGKPTILAVCAGKPVIGLPGNPVSAFVIANIFLLPMLRRISGLIKHSDARVGIAKLKINLPSVAGREDYWPVRLEKTESGWTADPIFYKSNLIFTLVKADALAVVPADANGMAAGSMIEFIPLR